MTMSLKIQTCAHFSIEQPKDLIMQLSHSQGLLSFPLCLSDSFYVQATSLPSPKGSSRVYHTLLKPPKAQSPLYTSPSPRLHDSHDSQPGTLSPSQPTQPANPSPSHHPPHESQSLEKSSLQTSISTSPTLALPSLSQHHPSPASHSHQSWS